MTRKKYIKQLMALGISKNEANRRALICQLNRRPYAQNLMSVKAARRICAALASFCDRGYVMSHEFATVASAIRKFAGGGTHD